MTQICMCYKKDGSSNGFIEQALVIGKRVFNEFGVSQISIFNSKCRLFGYARKVLDESSEQDLVAWSSLISGYAQNGLGEEALSGLGFKCNELTFASVLKACSIRKDLVSGKQVHGIVVVIGFDSALLGISRSDLGTRSALYANERESITVTVQEVTPRSVGALVALYERAVGIYASLINVNAYHQPGVEAGKKAAGEVLALQKRVLAVLNEASCKEPVEPLTLQEVAERCHAPDDIEVIYKIIAHMAANDRALIAEGSCGSPRSIKVFLGECNIDEMYVYV